MFFASASLSGAFSGLLAAAIMNMNGVQGKAGQHRMTVRIFWIVHPFPQDGLGFSS
jgi:hypothetical protein